MKKMMIAAAFAALTANPLAAGIRFDASMEVAIAPKASGPVQLAAQEMTNFLSRAFGKSIPIVCKLNPAKATIVLGTNVWSEAVGVDISKLRRDGYLMKTAGKALYIAGADAEFSIGYCRTHRLFDRGTMMGAYAFLEKFAGCRFYFPGELGEVVPSRYSISVPDLDFSDAPAFAERSYSYHNDGAWYDETLDKRKVDILKKLNCFRLRLASRNYITCHGLRSFRYGYRFKETHPEYFMLQKNGKRYLYDTEQSPYYKNCKLCFSSPELRDIVYHDVKAYVTKQPPQARGLESWGFSKWGNKYVGIEPEDGWEPCQCERCKAAYRPDLGASYATDLMWGFTKEIAERLTADGLDAVLFQSSYSCWMEPPDFDLPSNLVVRVAIPGPWATRRPNLMRSQLARLEKWTKKVGNPVLNWTYAGKFGVLGLDTARDIPNITPRAHGIYYKKAAPFLSGDSSGVYNESNPGRFLYDALNVYVLSRVAWDPSVDVDAILDEHYRLMYGSAAKDMQLLFETFEDIWLDRIYNGKIVQTNLGPKNIIPSEFEIWTDIYSPAKVEELLAKADVAFSKVADGSLAARRIALVRTEIIERLMRKTKEYNESLSVESEKASRAARKPVNLVKGFKPVTITVDNTMTNKPFYRVKYPLPDLKQGHRYRVSVFVKAENVVPCKARGGVQCTPWTDESMNLGHSFPSSGATGTFDWVHFCREYQVPNTDKFKPSVDLRVFFATGTAHFDGLLVEEVK